jgi:TolA-binding protein
MKAKERHHLKQNEFAVTAAKVLATYSAHQRRIQAIVISVIALVVIVAAVLFWRGRQADRGGEQLGIALAMLDATIAPAPTIPGATQAPGTFPTEQARAEAALAAFQQVATEFPNTDAGLAARYHAAGELMSLGRPAEAAQAFREVIAQAGSSSIYRPMARMGLAEAQATAGEHEQAIQVLSELSAERDTALPIDGVLMQLARVSLTAGKPDDARAAFRRVIDEFPQSIYAPDAQQQLAGLN